MAQSMRRLVDRLRALLASSSQRASSAPREPIALTDLLGRRAIDLDTPELQRFLAGKRVLVTGAGGSIGSEICRQSMKFCPQRMVLVERAEGALFEIDRELRHAWTGADVRPYVCDITDEVRLRHVIRAERPQVIFHCAAHKHVPMMELHPGEAIKNNALGTRLLADIAVDAGVATFVLISTDKAVNPSSVMGATKRWAELYVQSLNECGCQLSVVSCQAMHDRRDLPLTTSNYELKTHSPATRFVAVRFGNVLGSSGSVVPIFEKQIAAGGPVTVTHPEMKRYFMTIAEASQLVMQAGAIAKGGELFVLDMGSPVRIVELAEQMIRRRGLRVGQDIEIAFTGVRPGEKLFEELACDHEQTCPTSHPRIFAWQLPTANHAEMAESAAMLAAVVDQPAAARRALAAAVPEYRADEISQGARVAA